MKKSEITAFIEEHKPFSEKSGAKLPLIHSIDETGAETYKHRVELVTTADVLDFVKIAASVKGKVGLTNSNGFFVNGKSLLGAMTTINWDTLYCVSDVDIYSKIQKYCVA